MWMNGGWTLFRLARIPVRLHWSMPLLLLWMLPELGWQAFPLIVLFLLYVLCHEVGHALVAQDAGYAVDQILLSPVGGVAMIRAADLPPATEVRVAVAGPLVSLALALAGALLSAGLSSLGQDVAATLAWWLAAVPNAGLFLFNLVPAFPMDGGRVLRAALTASRGRTGATRVCASIGRGLALAFGVTAVFAWGDLRLAALAVVVWMLAGAEWRAELWRARLAGAGMPFGPGAADAGEWVVSPPPYARPRPAGLAVEVLNAARVLLRRLRPGNPVMRSGGI